MIRIIDGKRYNTATAEKVFGYWNGYSSSDFKYRTKDLYRTEKGAWFLHHEGGPLSDMAVSRGNGRMGSETIEVIDENDAFKFLQAHSDNAEALAAIEKYFSTSIVDA